MSLISLHALDRLLHDYGYATVFCGVLLESTGLPLPGESLLIAAAIYAATTHHLDIFLIVPIAAAGAICGDQIGYFIGRRVGYRLLARFGRKLGVSEERLQLSRYLFQKYGGRVVFLGRFVAVLRTFVALLSGALGMAWHSFLLWNALGGVGWTALYGFGAYALGNAAHRLSGPVGLGLGAVGAVVIVLALVFIKRNEARLLADARRQMQSTPQRAGGR